MGGGGRAGVRVGGVEGQRKGRMRQENGSELESGKNREIRNKEEWTIKGDSSLEVSRMEKRPGHGRGGWSASLEV